MRTGIVAVSYAHDSDDFNEKVVEFVSYLRKEHGYDAKLDEFFKSKETSVDFNEMMTKMIHEADKVIVLLTPKYKEKADKMEGGVGFEFRMILNELSKDDEKYKTKYIFASFEPLNDELIDRIMPAALGNREIVDLSNDEQWNNLFSKLSDEPIYDIPEVAIEQTRPIKRVVKCFQTTTKADLFIRTSILLSENKQILDQFGPDSLVAINNPMSSAVDTWNKAKIETIIPNNRRIVEDFEKNISVLSIEEVDIYKKFKLHAEAFERCNKGEIGREGIPQFPIEFEKMIREEN